MATVSLWTNVGVAVESALATALAIVSISKANPGLVTYTGTDPVNGDYVLLKVLGMHQLDYRIFKVANVNAGSNTFELSGENTTNYDTFSSGTAEVVTFGTTLATLTGLSASGGEAEQIDITTIHDSVRKLIPGVASPANYSFESFWDAADPGLVALKAAADNKTQRCVRFTFANGSKVLFVGYIAATLLPVGSAQDKVTTPVSVTMYGRPTVYSA